VETISGLKIAMESNHEVDTLNNFPGRQLYCKKAQ
jgi:hypothetical protein